jgi:hypothetical protein
MQLRRMIGTGAALLTLSLGTAAFAQSAEVYMPPPVQPVQPGQPGQPGQPVYVQPPGQPGQPGQPVYAPPYQPGQPGQPGQPVYVYPPGGQPMPGQPMPGYMPPGPPPRQVTGYKMAPRIGLIVGGSVMLGSMWIITAIAGGISTAIDTTLSCSGSNCSGSTSYWPLFIPVAGPFIQMGYINDTGASRNLAMFGLAFDGLVQVGGLTMIVLGATLKQRVPLYAKNWQVAPMFTSSGSGIAFTTRF